MPGEGDSPKDHDQASETPQEPWWTNARLPEPLPLFLGVYMGIMENRMETTIVYSGIYGDYIGVVLGLYWGCTGPGENGKWNGNYYLGLRVRFVSVAVLPVLWHERDFSK